MTLPEFEDQPVDRAALKVTKAGDGLSEALRIKPRAFHIGDELYCALRGVVTAINHVNQRGELVRTHILTTMEIAIVDRADLEYMMAQAADRMQRLRASIEGQTVLGEDED